MIHSRFRRSLGAAAVLAALSIGYVEAGLPGFGAKSTDVQVGMQTAASPARVGAMGLPDFSAIVEAAGPAVVNITVTGKAEKVATSAEAPQVDPDDPFYEFFRRFGPGARQGEPPAVQRGLGSGFIISSDGVILTNAHVVDGAREVVVKLTDKREFTATVVGVDRRSDVAVLRIKASGLPTVRIGNPADVKVGSWVLAIGSPFGFDNTATSGIVSAKSRVLPDGAYVPFIQTDVAVNPGNSGGPLFNMSGEVIGINSQIYSRSGGYQGVSFAIPIDVVTKVKDQLLAHGKVTRGRIGIGIQEVNQALADSFGLKRPQGALVNSVERGGPAEKAGLEAGDIIVSVDGKAVNDSADLPARISDMRPGDKARVELLRRGESRRVDVVIGELKEAKVAELTPSKETQGRLGLAVRPLNAAEQREAGGATGLVVEQSVGAAAQAGIRRGDVILAFNGTPVRSVEELRQQAAKSGKRAALLVQRDDTKIFVPIELG